VAQPLIKDQNQLKVPIHPKWDSSPHLFIQNQNHFHIQRNDAAFLRDFITRREEGALLVSGKRGVGKSSIIISSILHIIQELDKDNIVLLPIFVNAANFEIIKFQNINGNNNGDYNQALLELKRTVIVNLVRRLYQVTRNYKIKEENGTFKISFMEQNNLYFDEFDGQHNDSGSLASATGITNLYRRAVAKEATSTMKKEASEKIQTIIEKTFKIKTDLSKRFLSLIVAFIVGTIVGLYSPISDKFWNNVLTLFISSLPLISFTIESAWSKKIKSNIDNSTTASTLYLYDYNISNLEYEMELKLNNLKKKNCKVIFIIDEMDKLNTNDVKNVIKHLKTLFNQSYALYILVTGTEFFLDIIKEAYKRPIEYTLFSRTIFLQRPDFFEIKKFIDGIVDMSKKDVDQNAITILFEFDEVENGKKISDYLTNNHHQDDLTDIKELKILKNNDEITLMYEKHNEKEKLKKPNVTFSKKSIGKEIKLIIPNNQGKSSIFEFGILKHNEAYKVFLKSKNFIDFQYYICYLSKTDFFDLYKTLRDYIIYEDNIYKIKFKINDNIRTLANLQRALESIYQRKKLDHPSNWLSNDILLDKIYQFLSHITNRHTNIRYLNFNKEPFKIKLLTEVEQMNDQEQNNINSGDSLTNDIESLDELTKYLVKDTINDLVKFLLRLEFLLSTTISDTYEITGILPYIDISKKFHVNEEKEYIEQYENLLRIFFVYDRLIDIE
jgi:hypothetical protein